MAAMRIRCWLVAAALLCAGTARADEEPAFTIGAQPVWFLLGGLSTGGTVVAERGAFIGGELSLVRVRDARFVGIYTDAYYDFAVDGTYLTGGPELGFVLRGDLPMALGIDAGPAARFAGETQLGAAGRVSVTAAGTVSLYTRYLYFGSGANQRVVQIGVALKLPLIAPFGAGTL